MNSAFTHLESSVTAKRFEPDQLQTVCDESGKPLLARYDLELLAKSWKKEDLQARPDSMWRYAELLPVRDRSNVVSLGEPMTALLPVPRLGASIGLKHLHVKDETSLPTGTFKSRGLSMAVSKAVELGVKRVAIPSAGNAAEALSVYAARAGIECFVFMPEDAPMANQRICHAAGAHVNLVDGLISDAGKIVREGAEHCGWFDISTFREPYRCEGKKTMGLELAEQMNWALPDVIVYPTGGGTGLVGMWKAFDELEAIGWIGSQRPRMVAVQAQGCAPIVRAFEAGQNDAEFWQSASTIAGGLRVPYPLADRLILKALRDSGGCAIAVSDDDIREAMLEMSALEGVLPSPESAATWAAAKRLVAGGNIRPEESVVLFSCGTMLKHLDLVDTPDFSVLDPAKNIDYKMFDVAE